MYLHKITAFYVKHVQHDKDREVGEEHKKTDARKYEYRKEHYSKEQARQQLDIIDKTFHFIEMNARVTFYSYDPAEMKPVGHD